MDPKWSKHLLRRSRRHPKSTPKYFLRRYGWIHRLWFNDVGCLLSNSIIFGTTRAATIFFCRHEWTPCSTKTQQEWTWVDPTIRWMPGWSKILLYSIPHALLDNNISISLPTISTICALIDQHHKKTRDFKKKHQRSPFPFSAPAIGRLKLLHLQPASRSSRLLLPGVSAFRPDNVRSWWDRTTWSRVFRL